MELDLEKDYADRAYPNLASLVTPRPIALVTTLISGDQDQNYAAIKTTSKDWEANRMDYKFFDVPGMGHSNAEPDRLEAALKWIGL